MRRIGFIGYGAIGRRAAGLVAASGGGCVAGVLLRPGSAGAAQARADGVSVVADRDGLLALAPDLIVECAGQPALAEHGAAVLDAGADLLAASVGAFADAGIAAALRAAAGRSGAHLSVPSGAIGGIDALAAMRLAGLERVAYTGRKPPEAWGDAPGAPPRVVFAGDAGAAARLWPKNANVAATVALAGLGFADTEVTLLADPGVRRNVHEIRAQGATGLLELRLEGLPDPGNPRTSALTAASVAAVALGRVGGLRIDPEG